MKYAYIYNNSVGCYIDSITEFENLENVKFHSKEVSNKTINKEKGDNKFLHIFKEHSYFGEKVYKHYVSYCV